MTSDVIEVATGLSDVDRQVDNKGPLDSQQHANLTVYAINNNNNNNNNILLRSVGTIWYMLYNATWILLQSS